MIAWNSEKKVGLLALAGAVCLAGLVLFIGKVHLGTGGYRVRVLFNFVDSLRADAPVLYGGGVRIGRVERIEALDNRVAVTCRMDDDIKIPSGARITINTTGILGEKYIQVEAQDLRDGILAPGATVEGVDPGSLDRTLQKLEQLASLFTGREGGRDLDRILSRGGDLVSDLAEISRASKADIIAALRSLRKASAQLEKAATDENLAHMKNSLAELDAASERLNRAMKALDEQKGTLGVLIHDPETAENLRELLEDLKSHPWKLLWKK